MDKYGEKYRSIINRKGLRNCPFCGTGVVIKVMSRTAESNPFKKLILSHRGETEKTCCFSSIEELVLGEEEVIEFLDKWNRREG